MRTTPRSNAWMIGVIAGIVGIMPGSVMAQGTGRIQGKVVEAATLRPLNGVQVFVEGTQRGALTNAAGQYLILNVPAGAHTVRVQMMGYRETGSAVQVTAEATATLDFSLAMAAIAMNEIVVTGTAGAVSKRVLGNAVTTVNAADITQKSTVSTVTELLMAKSPGVNVMPGGGTVGTGASIRIRGTGSVTGGNSPVVYVDGVRVHAGAQGNFSNTFSNSASGQESMAFDLINPDDIESIEIIKGPAAATLYGADAAGGVIQIITKKGKPGQQNLQWNARVQYGQTDWAVDRITNYTECTAARKALDPTRTGGFPGCQNVPVGTILESTGLDNPAALRSGDVRGYAVSVNGGGEGYSFYLSAERDEEEGIWYNNFSNQSSVRSNFAFSPTEKLDFYANLAFTRSHIRYPINDNSDAGLIYSVAVYSPGMYMAPDRLDGFGYRTPAEAYVWDNQLRADRFTVGGTVNYRPMKWLRNRLTVGIDSDERLAEKFIPPGPSGGVFMEPLGYVGQSTPKDTYLTSDYIGTITHQVRPELTSETSFGMQYVTHEYQRTLVEGRDLGSSVVKVVGAAATRTGAESYSKTASLGLFLQEQLGWRDRLFVIGAVRMDNSSVFGDEIQRLFYPKASVAYVISDEDFFKLPGVEQLKLRAAWGQAGNAPAPFAANRTYVSSTAVTTGGGTTPAVRFGSYGNPNLKPEKGEELEVGFEASLLAGRLGVDLTYYNKRMKDAIMSVAVAPSTGFTGSRYENLGETLNTGVELVLSGTPIQTRPATWESSLSATTNRNELVSFGYARDPIKFGTSAPIHQFREGYPLGGMWAFGPKRNADGTLVRNASGGLIVGDTVYLGPVNPKIELGFANTVTFFGNVQLFVLVDYKGGHYTYNRKDSSRCAAERCKEIIGADQETIDLLKAPRTINVLPWVQKADFAKLRDVSLSYTLPTRWSQKYKIDRARVSIAGHNLAIWKREYTGPDPEVNYTGVSEFERQDAWTAPMTRRVTSTITLTF